MKNKSKSSQCWLQRRDKDLYGKLAQDHSYRSRAIFKLQDIDNKYHILPKAKTILDLGDSLFSSTEGNDGWDGTTLFPSAALSLFFL